MLQSGGVSNPSPMRTLLNTAVARLSTAVATVALSATMASAQSISFNAPSGCPGGDCGPVNTVGGLTWYFGKLLNVDDYKASVINPDLSSKTGYPTGGVLLGQGQLQVQSAGWNPFWLNSLSVGSGWLNGITLRLEGYLELGGPTVMNESITLNASKLGTTTAETPTAWNFAPAGPIRYFMLYVDWNQNDMPFWDGTGEAPAWTRECNVVGSCVGSYDVDPWGSRTLKEIADRTNGVDYDGDPYKTYFISGAQTTPYTVPEPASLGLMAAGLMGLAGAARRRRSSK